MFSELQKWTQKSNIFKNIDQKSLKKISHFQIFFKTNFHNRIEKVAED